MSFGNYSRYYDLLYADKDYEGEAAYIDALLKTQGSGVESILELGSGTGRHARLLADCGYSIVGVELSPGMLEESRKFAELGRVEFVEGDIRTARVERRFDAVLSLFHVISYLPANKDIIAAFQTAVHHLVPGGVFIFDCWYGPAVLTDRPETRVKRAEDDEIELTRLAEPDLYENENRVDVNYTLFVTDKSSGRQDRITETHRMRYLFKPEIEYLLEQAGLALVHAESWMDGGALGGKTFGACFVARVGP